MILKTRVPGTDRKHLIQQFLHNNETLYADLTLYREQFGYGEIPIYTLDENQDVQLYGYMDAETLSEIGP